MGGLLGVHIGAGALALVTGAVALSVGKGGPVHRRSGMLFVGAMLVMAVTGAAIAAWTRVEASVIASVVTAYFVVTALMTVRPALAGSRGPHLAAMLVAGVTSLTSLVIGVHMIATGTSQRDGLPAFPFFLFGIVGLLASAADVRILRDGALRGTRRLARHLWRMCFALYVAASSFFLGQSDEFPEALRIPVLLALPVVAVLIAMFYWLWRVRRTSRGISWSATSAA